MKDAYKETIENARALLQKRHRDLIAVAGCYGEEIWGAFDRMLVALGINTEVYQVESVITAYSREYGHVVCFIQGTDLKKNEHVPDVANGDYDEVGGILISDIAWEISQLLGYINEEDILQAWEIFEEVIPEDIEVKVDKNFAIGEEYLVDEPECDCECCDACHCNCNHDGGCCEEIEEEDFGEEITAFILSWK